MLAEGGIPQGDYVPAPWLLLERGMGRLGRDLGRRASASISTAGSRSPSAGPPGRLRLHLLCDPSPAARLRHYLRLTGFPTLMPEWAYGHWKSRDVYEHQDDVLDDLDGYVEHGLPLDAIVIDSPWETQYNTWRFNPHQFPDAKGMIDRLRAEGVRTVVWVTPWVNLDSTDGQRPPDPESERLHRRPAAELRRGRCGPATSSAAATAARTSVAGGWASARSSTSPRRRPAAGGRSKPAACSSWGSRGSRPTTARGTTSRRRALRRPPQRRRGGLGLRGPLPAHDAGGARRGPSRRPGCCSARCGWSGQQATGFTWGGDQVSDFWSLRTLVAATLTAAASGFSNWSHDVGGYLGRRLVERCPRELLLRWVQFGCFTPLMQAHGRFEQEAWRYDDHTLDIYREYVLLHERLVPYIRAAAATAARSRAADHPPAGARPTQPTNAAGGSPTPTASAPPLGGAGARARRRASAGSTCREASGSTSGRASGSAGEHRGRSRRRRASGSRCGCEGARSSSPTRPSSRLRARDRRTSRSGRWRRRCGGDRAADAQRPGSRTGPR